MLFKSKKCSNCVLYYDPTLEQCPICHKDNELYKQRGFPRNIIFFHPAAQIGLFLCGFAYIGMLITEILAAIYLSGIKDNGLRTAAVLLATYLMMIGALLLICFTTRRKSFIKRFARWPDYLFGLAYAGGLFGIGIVINMIVSIFYQGVNNNQTTAIEIINNYPIIATFVLCLLGPICEELTYRVGLYSFLRRINKVLAFIVAVIVFALIHFDFTASDIIGELWSLPSYIACGAVLTVAYIHRGPACSMTAHIVYNTIAMLMVVLAGIVDGL